jgi:hypothetical protein
VVDVIPATSGCAPNIISWRPRLPVTDACNCIYALCLLCAGYAAFATVASWLLRLKTGSQALPYKLSVVYLEQDLALLPEDPTSAKGTNVAKKGLLLAQCVLNVLPGRLDSFEVMRPPVRPSFCNFGEAQLCGLDLHLRAKDKLGNLLVASLVRSRSHFSLLDCISVQRTAYNTAI